MHDLQNPEVKAATTRTIWSCALGMLVFCIPLSAITSSALIPLAVIVGAAVATVAVWLYNGQTTTSRSETNALNELAATKKQLQEMEERLFNMETLSRFDHDLTTRTSNQPLSSPPPRVERESF